MKVLHSKVQWVPIQRRLPDGGEETFFVRIGFYVELDDGHAIRCPDGVIRRGAGTIARYNFKHGTWSVQPPQRGKLTSMGYVFVHGMPEWELPILERGLSHEQFRRSYSKTFVNICLQQLTMW